MKTTKTKTTSSKTSKSMTGTGSPKPTKTSKISVASSSSTLIIKDPKTALTQLKDYLRTQTKSGAPTSKVGKSSAKWASIHEMVAWYGSQGVSINPSWFGRALKEAAALKMVQTDTEYSKKHKKKITIFRVA